MSSAGGTECLESLTEFALEFVRPHPGGYAVTTDHLEET
jgi:hypothetical protein